MRIGKNPSEVLHRQVLEAVQDALSTLGYTSAAVGMTHWNPDASLGVSSLTISLRRSHPEDSGLRSIGSREDVAIGEG